jgi:capsular exopolysaccharide synthesis family protein
MSLARRSRVSRHSRSSASDIPPLLDLPVLAEVPTINRRLPSVQRGQVVRLDPRSRAAEAYRGIRAALDLTAAGAAGSDSAAATLGKVVLVTSASPGDGKSTTASNLAIALANAGQRTLLIDADLIRPVQHMIFNADPSSGLSSVAGGAGKLADAISPTAVQDLYLLPAGPLPANPSDLLTGKRFALQMEALRGAFDRIVIDSPPLSTSADANVLARSADGTLLVVRMNRSLRETAAAAAEALQRAGASLLGVVANDVQAGRAPRRYAYAGLGGPAAYADRQIVVRSPDGARAPAVVETAW